MRTLALLCAAAAALLASAATAAAAPGDGCKLKITQSGRSTVTGDSLTGDDYGHPLEVVLSNSGDEACVGVLAFNQQGGWERLKGTAGETLQYSIVDQYNTALVLLDPLTRPNGTPVEITIPAGGQVLNRPRVIVTGLRRSRAGDYRGIIEAQFTTPDGYLERSNIHIDAYLTPAVQANLVGLQRPAGAGVPGALILGELSPGLSKQLALQVRANSDVDVEITSTNRGRLMSTKNPAAVPYSLRMEGGPVPLGAPYTVPLTIEDAVIGRTSPMEVVVGQYGNTPAGTYTDLITLVISAK